MPADFVHKKATDDVLERLLRSAATARLEARSEISLAVRARIIAAWRSGPNERETLLRMLRRAVLAAAAVSSVTVAFTFAAVERDRTEPEPQVVEWVTNSLQGMELSWIQAEVERQSGIEPEYP